MATFLLVDAHNLFHRCMYSSSGDISTKSGMALHIILNSIRASWRKFNADHVVFCLEGKSWRHDYYPAYKAHRRLQQQLLTKKEKEDQDFFFETMNYFCSFLKEKTNITVLQSNKIEGDDFIARWIQLHPDDQHIIISGDTDFYQLLANNVKIYDGMKHLTISIDAVLDEDNSPAMVKKKVKEKINGKIVTKTIDEPLSPPNPEYELFFKIIRGDSTDNIMSAYPGVREKGSAKKPGILEAFNDRNTKGFDWNNFMLQEWKKYEGDIDGEPVYQTVKVLDEFKKNSILIDLSKQPDDIKELMDTIILDSINKPKVQTVGVWFLKFTNEMNLVTIGKNPTEYATILNSGYPK